MNQPIRKVSAYNSAKKIEEKKYCYIVINPKTIVQLFYESEKCAVPALQNTNYLIVETANRRWKINIKTAKLTYAGRHFKHESGEPIDGLTFMFVATELKRLLFRDLTSNEKT